MCDELWMNTKRLDPFVQTLLEKIILQYTVLSDCCSTIVPRKKRSESSVTISNKHREFLETQRIALTDDEVDDDDDHSDLT